MHRGTYRITLPCATLAALVLWACIAFAGPPEVVVVGDQAPPFRIMTSGTPSGIYFDTITELGKRMGFTPKFVVVPQKRAMTMMMTGEADLMPGPNWSVERETFLHYPRAYFPAVKKAFYVRKDSRTINAYHDLYGLRIGVVLGKYYFSRFDTDDTLDKDPVHSYELAFEKLVMGRNDVVIAPAIQGDYLVHVRRLPVTKSPYTVAGSLSYICVSRRSPFAGRLDEMEEALNQMKDDGTLAAILQRYEVPAALP